MSHSVKSEHISAKYGEYLQIIHHENVTNFVRKVSKVLAVCQSNIFKAFVDAKRKLRFVLSEVNLTPCALASKEERGVANGLARLEKGVSNRST